MTLTGTVQSMDRNANINNSDVTDIVIDASDLFLWLRNAVVPVN
jgi:hypothetical protein